MFEILGQYILAKVFSTRDFESLPVIKPTDNTICLWVIYDFEKFDQEGLFGLNTVINQQI